MTNNGKMVGLVALFILVAFWAGISWEKMQERHLRPIWSVSHNETYNPRNNNLENLMGSSDQITRVDIVTGCVEYRKLDGSFMGDCIDMCPLIPKGYSLSSDSPAAHIPNIRILQKNLNP
jgi:hypothetical protein